MKTSIHILLAAGLVLVGFVRLHGAEPMPMKSEILAAYVKVAEALAADNLASAKAAASELAEHARMVDQKSLAGQAGAVANAGDLTAARSSFKALSSSVVPLAAGEKGYTVMTCPMAKADWVQTSSAVKNPYYGKSMLTCGSPKKNGHKSGDAKGHEGHKM